jgi:Fe-S-cluster containining protein
MGGPRRLDRDQVGGMTRRSDRDAALQAIYDKIPEMQDCKGHCWLSCGPIEMSDRERQRIRELGVRITPGEEARRKVDTFWCEALDSQGHCRVYERRPFICRLWGTTPKLKCPHGCTPKGGYLSDLEGLALMSETMRAGGGDALLASADEVRARMKDPVIAQQIHDFMWDGFDGDEIRLREYGTVLPREIRER